MGGAVLGGRRHYRAGGGLPHRHLRGRDDSLHSVQAEKEEKQDHVSDHLTDQAFITTL